VKGIDRGELINSYSSTDHFSSTSFLARETVMYDLNEGPIQYNIATLGPL